MIALRAILAPAWPPVLALPTAADADRRISTARAAPGALATVALRGSGVGT